MIADLISDCLPECLEADVCVVGSGPVGITLALALSRKNARVILLESGGRKAEPALQDLNRSTNVGRNHNGINFGRYRALGGNSTVWGGQILPFNPIDFARRDWVEASGWPISFDDLKPYYAEALHFEGLGDCLTDDDEVVVRSWYEGSGFRGRARLAPFPVVPTARFCSSPWQRDRSLQYYALYTACHRNCVVLP